MAVSMPFSLRVRLGQCEVEISGSKDEVLKTFEDLPSLVAVISEAFSGAGVQVSSALPTGSGSPNASFQSRSVSVAYPSIQSTGNCSDAVMRLLETDWGRVVPRTLPELIEAMKTNAVHYPATTLSGVLNWLVRKGKVKRWKTDKGYVYILAGPNITPIPSQTQAQSATQAEKVNTKPSEGGF